jgi:hypothetical protein
MHDLFLRFNGPIPQHLTMQHPCENFNHQRNYEILAQQRLVKSRMKNTLQKHPHSPYPSKTLPSASHL